MKNKLKSIRKYSLIFIILIFSCCQKNVKTNLAENLKSDKENLKEKIQHKKVIITGTSDDPKSLKHFLIINNSYLFGTNHKYSKKDIFNDSIRIELDSIKQSQLLEIWVHGDTLQYTRIYVTPGDTLKFKIENKKLQFIGKNAAYNNFFIALENEQLFYRNNPYQGDIEDYKRNVEIIYNKKISFFKEYLGENKKLSNDFVTLINDILKYEYLNNLIQPRSVLVEKMNWYVNSQYGVLSTIDLEYDNKENLFNLKDYTGNVTIEDFKRPDLLKNSWAFKNSLDSYIRFYFNNNDFLNYSQEAFLAEKEFIQKNFDGEIENYAIARMIREYNFKGFGYSKKNIVLLKSLMKEYDEQFTKPSYKEKMSEIAESLDNFNFKLPKNALNSSKLINQVGDTTTLRGVFNNSVGRIKVIDFWASWCPPCIREIKKAKNFQNKLSNENNVEWIYISIDKDYNTWLNKTIELDEYMHVKNQYYLLGGQKSSLAKSLNVHGIPRYVIFNKKEEIVLDNAPQPSNTIVFKKIIDEINLNIE